MKTLTNVNQLSSVNGGVGFGLITTGMLLSNTMSMAYGEGLISYDTYCTSMVAASTITLTGTTCLYLEGCRDGKNMTKSIINTVLDIF